MTIQSAGFARDVHARHDREAIAAYAAGDAFGAARAHAAAQVSGCAGCAALASDLRAIAAATRDLPPPIELSGDYRLTADDARRARGGPFRRILGTLGLPAWNPRPFAAALMTVGFAGLMISALPLISFGSGGARFEAAAGASGEKALQGATGGDTASTPVASGPSAGSGAVGPVAVYPSADRSFTARESLVPEDLVATPAPTETPAARAPGTAPSQAPGTPLVLVSLGFIGAGGVVFVIGGGTRRSR